MPIEEIKVPEQLKGHKILLGVAGSIAAYKMVDFAAQLRASGADLRVIMTPAASQLISPTAFSAITGYQVEVEMFSQSQIGEIHIELAKWADVVLIAPATASTLHALAYGEADTLLAAVVLSARCPVVIAPAMHSSMWEKPQVEENIKRLKAFGYHVVEPEMGRLASGEVGTGRLASFNRIVRELARLIYTNPLLQGMSVIVTAGGTMEPIDPVRFIGNRSSGKMGFALARAAAELGAKVKLVTTVDPPEDLLLVEVHKVLTADQMLEKVLEVARDARILFMAAAVADFRPAQPYSEKIKREQIDKLQLQLLRNVDIIKEVKNAYPNLAIVAFAAEDKPDLEPGAIVKLHAKNVEAVFANDISRPDVGFGSDHNAGVLVIKNGKSYNFPRMTKDQIAREIVQKTVAELFSSEMT